jgi:hypothetical protein
MRRSFTVAQKLKLLNECESYSYKEIAIKQEKVWDHERSQISQAGKYLTRKGMKPNDLKKLRERRILGKKMHEILHALSIMG